MPEPAPRDSASGEDPADLVRRLDAEAEHVSSSCGAGTMAWRAWGAGRPLVLVHGGHGSWTHWIRNLQDLSRSFRVIAPDLPGHGDTATPEAPFTGERLGEILAAGLDAAVPSGEAFDLVGFSFGAVIAGHAARLRPGRVRHFVMVGPGGLALPREPRPDLTSWRRLPDPEAQLAAHRCNLAALMLRDPAKIDRLALHLQSENTRRARIRTYLISRTDTLFRCLPEIAAPVSGIWGVEDVTARGHFDVRRDLLARLGDGAFHLIGEAGHWVQYETPDAFNACLRAVLARQEPAVG